MKTIVDLNALIPKLIGILRNSNHKIGESYYEKDEDGYGLYENYETNTLIYDEDGWDIEIIYECCGKWDFQKGDYLTPASCDLVKAWGRVVEIYAYHYDEDTDDEIEFEESDTKEIEKAINMELKTIKV